MIGGDGIGPEVMAPAIDDPAPYRRDDARIEIPVHRSTGRRRHYRDTGTALPDATVKLCEKADAILLGACGLPSIRYPDNTEIRPQVDLRFIFDLYAGVRPCRLIPGVPCPIVGADEHGIDLVIIRESTEGLFHSIGKGVVTKTKRARRC